jgi:hypothetical protein
MRRSCDTIGYEDFTRRGLPGNQPEIRPASLFGPQAGAARPKQA